MEKITINDIKYELIENYKKGFELEDVKEKCTDYFNDFDYIIGDYAYGKLRLKGFYDKQNKKCKSLNNIQNKDKYLKNECAYECRYFVLKKIGGQNGNQ